MEELITSPFGFASTAAEVVAGIDLSGKRAVVTGGASGIGVETAKALAGAGADVTLAVRNVEIGAKVAADIMRTTGNPNIQVLPLELTDATSIQAFINAWTVPLDILINNAGVMALPKLQLGQHGCEMQFETNHLGHFALSTGLHKALAAAGNARVVVVSSAGHFRSPMVFEDINFTRRSYDPWAAYGQSKTANILFAVEAAKQWRRDGISVNALHPGGIRTQLQRHVPAEEWERMQRQANTKFPMKNVEQGAATSVFVATSPLLESIGGKYFADSKEAPITAARPDDSFGVAAYALNPNDAHKLWEQSEAFLGF